MQEPDAATSQAGARARYFNAANAFALETSPVPDIAFTAEPAAALAPDAATGFIACDISSELDIAGPATTPLLLAQYATIQAGQTLHAECAATASIWYVIAGGGRTTCNGETFDWAAGDVFLLPGGAMQQLEAGPEPAVLWLVGNEPHLAFEGLQPPAPDAPVTAPVHYPAAELARQMARIYQIEPGEKISGRALIFSSAEQAHRRNILPSLTLALNSVPPGGAQPPHKHNSVAVALVIQGQDCYSLVDGRQKNWSPWATTITPPGAVHSHHNDGTEQALFLIVQDGGLYNHARTMDFAFA